MAGAVGNASPNCHPRAQSSLTCIKGKANTFRTAYEQRTRLVNPPHLTSFVLLRRELDTFAMRKVFGSGDLLVALRDFGGLLF